MGNKQDSHIHAQFILSVPRGSNKSKQTKCRHCPNYDQAYNPTRMKKHLLIDCEPYRASITARRGSFLCPQGLTFTAQPQKTIAALLLEPEEIRKKHMAGAYAIYCGGHPFSLYDEPYMNRFLTIIAPGKKPPTRSQLSGTLLEACYKETRLAVMSIVATTTAINLITDESSTAARDKVINFCIHTPRGPFYIKNDPIPAGTSSAERQTAWILKTLNDIEAEHDFTLSMINSIATDSTMRKLWRALRADRRFVYTFFVPCDSHGTNLLINDIINLNEFKPIVKTVNEIIAHFRCAHEQLALLREFQKKQYSKIYAFVLSAETPWGTCFYSLISLERVKEALKAFARCPINECGNQTILNNILDPSFWNKVDDLIKILRPINQRQIQSENSHSHLGHVGARWREIRFELSTHSRQYPQLLHVFDLRMPIQILDIHLAAFHLDPLNIRTSYSVGSDQQSRILDFLRTHTPSEDHEDVIHQYLDYKGLHDNFLDAELWSEKAVKDPVYFWILASAYAPQLAALARRLFLTPSSSVPSERAFNAMKLNSGRYRATMKLSMLDMLHFIHINRRILDRDDEKHHKSTKFYGELTDEQAIDMEDDLEAVEHAELINSLTKGLERQVENVDIEAVSHIARA